MFHAERLFLQEWLGGTRHIKKYIYNSLTDLKNLSRIIAIIKESLVFINYG